MIEQPGWDRRSHPNPSNGPTNWRLFDWIERHIQGIIIFFWVVMACVFLAAGYVITHFLAKWW